MWSANASAVDLGTGAVRSGWTNLSATELMQTMNLPQNMGV